MADIAARFFEKFIPEPNSGCWLWLEGLNDSGYAKFWDGSKQVRAHRYAYEHFIGPIPNGLTLDHLCRVRCCVNPAHLEPVTVTENVMRGFSPPAVYARRTHCANGHEFTPENTRRWFDEKRGAFRRQCKTCKNDVTRLWRQRLRTAKKRAWSLDDALEIIA